MTTTPFGAPVASDASDYSHDHDQSQENGAAGASSVDQAQVVIDIDDPKLSSEALDVNTEGDAYAQPAPPPDGKYFAKLTLEQVEDSKKQKHDYLPKQSSPSKGGPGQTYLFTCVKAQIIDQSGKYDGLNVYDRWVGTYMTRENTTKVATILARLKKPDGGPWIEKGRRYTQREWMDLLVQALKGEPTIGVETQWEWSCRGCGEEAKEKHLPYPRSIQGMNKFPQDPKTHQFLPEMKCQVNPRHEYTRAQVRVARFLSLEEMKAGK